MAMNKLQMQEKLAAAGIAFDPEATNLQLEALLEPVLAQEKEAAAKKVADEAAAQKAAAEAAAAAQAAANAVADFSFAVNSVKLNRAKKHVQQTQPSLTGMALANAVQQRYVLIGGLLASQKVARAPKAGGRMVNVADNDGSVD